MRSSPAAEGFSRPVYMVARVTFLHPMFCSLPTNDFIQLHNSLILHQLLPIKAICPNRSIRIGQWSSSYFCSSFFFCNLLTCCFIDSPVFWPVLMCILLPRMDRARRSNIRNFRYCAFLPPKNLLTNLHQLNAFFFHEDWTFSHISWRLSSASSSFLSILFLSTCLCVSVRACECESVQKHFKQKFCKCLSRYTNEWKKLKPKSRVAVSLFWTRKWLERPSKKPTDGLDFWAFSSDWLTASLTCLLYRLTEKMHQKNPWLCTPSDWLETLACTCYHSEDVVVESASVEAAPIEAPPAPAEPLPVFEKAQPPQQIDYAQYSTGEVPFGSRITQRKPDQGTGTFRSTRF